jgi:hypothetical protein
MDSVTNQEELLRAIPRQYIPLQERFVAAIRSGTENPDANHSIK